MSAPTNVERVALEGRLNDLLHLEQTFWRQRSRVFWLTDGDLNTRFFHQRATNRRRRNLLKGLFNEAGVWCSEENAMEDIVVNDFSGLFTSSNPLTIDEVTSVVPRLISDEMNQSLIQEITIEEVWQSLKQMHPSKAPGPDGFSQVFIHASGLLLVRIWLLLLSFFFPLRSCFV